MVLGGAFPGTRLISALSGREIKSEPENHQRRAVVRDEEPGKGGYQHGDQRPWVEQTCEHGEWSQYHSVVFQGLTDGNQLYLDIRPVSFDRMAETMGQEESLIGMDNSTRMFGGKEQTILLIRTLSEAAGNSHDASSGHSMTLARIHFTCNSNWKTPERRWWQRQPCLGCPE